MGDPTRYSCFFRTFRALTRRTLRTIEWRGRRRDDGGRNPLSGEWTGWRTQRLAGHGEKEVVEAVERHHGLGQVSGRVGVPVPRPVVETVHSDQAAEDGLVEEEGLGRLPQTGERPADRPRPTTAPRAAEVVVGP